MKDIKEVCQKRDFSRFSIVYKWSECKNTVTIETFLFVIGGHLFVRIRKTITVNDKCLTFCVLIILSQYNIFRFGVILKKFRLYWVLYKSEKS